MYHRRQRPTRAARRPSRQLPRIATCIRSPRANRPSRAARRPRGGRCLPELGHSDTVPLVTDIRYPVASGTLPAHLAVPTTPGPWPGVVVLHEIFGLTDDIRAQADRLAERGYLAIAPDLFAWGATPRCLVASFRAMANGEGRLFDDVESARRFLVDRDDCTGHVGV